MTLKEYAEQGAMSRPQQKQLEAAIVRGWNILIAGDVGSGKTMLFHAVLNRMAEQADAPIIAIVEDQEVEIQDVGDMVFLLAKNDEAQRMLLQKAPRLCPERVAVDQLRGGAVLDTIAAWLCGYVGVATIEANSVQNALRKIEQLMRAGGVQPDGTMIADVITLVICLDACKVKELAEVQRYTDSKYQLVYFL